MKFAFTADVHLRPCAWSNRPTLRNDAIVGLRQVIDYCITQKINLVLGGDLFDSVKPPSEAVVQFVQQAQRMRAAGLMLFCIDGNHDNADPSWITLAAQSTSAPDEFVNVINVDCKPFEPAPGIRAFGVSYQPATLLKQTLANVPPDTEVLVLHQMMDWAFKLDGVWNCKADDIPAYVKMVLLGDFHKPATHEDPRHIVMAYPGSLAMQEIREDPSKSFIVVEKTAAGLKLDRVPIFSRPYLETTINNGEQLDQLDAHLQAALVDARVLSVPEEIRMPILKVVYAAGVQDAEARIRKIVGERAHLWTVPWSLDQATANYTQITNVSDISVENVLAQLIDPKVKGMLFHFVHDLLMKNDPAKALAELRLTTGVDVKETVAVESH